MKKYLSILLVVAMFLVMIPFSALNVSSKSNIQAKIDQLLAVYPTGSYFTTTGKPHYILDTSICPDDCGVCQLQNQNPNKLGGLPAGYETGMSGWQCWAFANYAFYHIFGNYGRSFESCPQVRLADAKLGDIVSFTLSGYPHYGVYLYTSGSNVVVYDGNGDYYCGVRYGSSYSVNSVNTVYRAPNYDEVNGDAVPQPDTITYANISNGTYYIKNNFNGEYVSVSYNSDVQGQNVNTWTFDPAPYEQMVFNKTSGDGYKIRPALCASRLINSYGTTVSSGNNVNIWDDVNDSSQWWGLEKVSGGFVIRNMMNPSCVLTRTTTSTSDKEINVSTYTGSTSQIWTLQNYITYDANGGSGAPSGQLKNYDETLYLSSTKPTRSGYTFLGWSTSPNATSASYSAGGNFTSNSNTTLYAVWGNSTYTVSYNANGGSGAPSSQTKTHGVNLTLSSVIPTRTGYTFLGWSTSSSATSATYTPGGSFTSNFNTTLYAVWGKNTYTVSFNANGGTGAPSAQTKTHGVNLTLSSVIPTRTGYTFLGWSTSSSATSATYSAGGVYSTNGSITLYAVWEINACIITFDANGGTGAPPPQIIMQGVEFALTSEKPTRPGYSFYGWSTSSSPYASVTAFPNSMCLFNSDVTLYAMWSADAYTIRYDANGGTGAPEARIKFHDSDFTLSAVIPTRSGYSFLGWAIYSSATTATYSAGGVYSANADVTLYAVWKANTYTISFNANGGTGAPSDQVKYHGTNLTLNSTKPTRLGYTFLGWSTNSSATSATYSAGGSFDLEANTTLYAVWKKSGYSVIYDANGGSGAPEAQTKTQGVDLTLRKTLPTRSGYTFLGWATHANATAATYSAGGIYTKDSNITLYAVWKANTYTVAYDANGGTGAPVSQMKTHGVDLTLRKTIPVRTGYTFLGWGIRSTATGAAYATGGTYVNDANVTLYAVWKANEYTITYDANGGSGAPVAQTKIHGVVLELRKTTPTRSGYTFLGWSTNANATKATYSAGGTFVLNSDTVLYAVWESPESEIVLGDVTGDNRIGALDYVKVKRYCMGTLALSEKELKAADVDKNGRVNVMDYVLIKRHCMGTYKIK